jgi:hypothetical protein
LGISPVPEVNPVHHSAPIATVEAEPRIKSTHVGPASETLSHAFTPKLTLNTQSSSKRPANVVATASSQKKPALTLENYPCIIPDPKQKGRWIELRCYICQGNAREDGLFLKGLKGLKRHMQLSHKAHFSDLPLKQQFSLEASTVRSFNEQELDDMLAGKIERVQMISCPKETNVGDEGAVKIEDPNSGVAAPGDRPFDFLEAWPTVVLREDMFWIEIRCFSVSTRWIMASMGMSSQLTRHLVWGQFSEWQICYRRQQHVQAYSSRSQHQSSEQRELSPMGSGQVSVPCHSVQ